MASLTNVVMEFEGTEQLRRRYRSRYMPLEMDDLTDETIRSVYRFNKRQIYSIARDLQPIIGRKYIHENLRGRRLSTEEHLVVALKFYAHGTSFRSLGEQYGIGIGTVSRIIHYVTNAIIECYSGLIQMPVTREECSQISFSFYEVADMPNIVGCVDGCLIPIQRPSRNEHVFVSRKGFHAMNAMFVCRPNLLFSYVDAKFPGATQDAAVYRESSLRQAFVDGVIPQGYLLGDSGYALSSHLLTPVLNPQGRAANNYNRAHRRTRNVIERAFGVMKSRFRCLDRSGGPLRFSPEKCARVINAVALLHNKAIEMRLSDVDALMPSEEADDDTSHVADSPSVQALEIRNSVIAHFDN